MRVVPPAGAIGRVDAREVGCPDISFLMHRAFSWLRGHGVLVSVGLGLLTSVLVAVACTLGTKPAAAGIVVRPGEPRTPGWSSVLVFTRDDSRIAPETWAAYAVGGRRERGATRRRSVRTLR